MQITAKVEIEVIRGVVQSIVCFLTKTGAIGFAARLKKTSTKRLALAAPSACERRRRLVNEVFYIYL